MISIFMILVVSIFPGLAERLIDLINSKSMYARQKYKPPNGIEHIVVLGTVG